jgi:hypothetical protein
MLNIVIFAREVPFRKRCELGLQVLWHASRTRPTLAKNLVHFRILPLYAEEFYIFLSIDRLPIGSLVVAA